MEIVETKLCGSKGGGGRRKREKERNNPNVNRVTFSNFFMKRVEKRKGKTLGKEGKKRAVRLVKTTLSHFLADEEKGGEIEKEGKGGKKGETARHYLLGL